MNNDKQTYFGISSSWNALQVGVGDAANGISLKLALNNIDTIQCVVY
jgi:hypothetical protein